MSRRLIIAAVVLLLLGGAGVIAWELADLPPVGFVLRYGYPSPMGPTGRTMEVEGVEFVEISPGYSCMGSHYLCDEGDLLGRLSAALGLTWGQPPMHRDECPIHWVEFENGFWIARTEVTNEQYEQSEPGRSRRSPWSLQGGEDDEAAVSMSWEEAMDYCAWLGKKAGLPIRLPSEAEWECACRAGSEGEFTFGDDEVQLSRYARFDKYGHAAPAVATKQANRWGLFDLHGNVSEWCGGTFYRSYSDAPTNSSAWAVGADDRRLSRTIRGGSYLDLAADCRSAKRGRAIRDAGSPLIGFRPAFTLPPEK